MCSGRGIDLFPFIFIVFHWFFLGFKGNVEDNLSKVYTATPETPRDVIIDEEITKIIEILKTTGIVIAFTEPSFRDIIIIDPGFNLIPNSPNKRSLEHHFFEIQLTLL